MATILIKPECSDSPRSIFLKDLHIAFAHGNTRRLEELLPNDIRWQIVGRKKMGEIERCWANKMVIRCKMEELIIKTIVTDGLDTCVSGTIRFNEGSQFSFSNLVRFKRTIKTEIDMIETFMIAL